MAKAKGKDDSKPAFDTSNAGAMATLKKHMMDWFNNHRGEEFISPMTFQQTYPQFDKYDSSSFRKPYYAIKKRILNGE